MTPTVFHPPALPGHHPKFWIVGALGLIVLLFALRTPTAREKPVAPTATPSSGLPVAHLLVPPAAAPSDAITGSVAQP